MELSDQNKIRVDELIDICKKYQGEYIPGGHGSGSWATTYSIQFIEASSELYVIFQKSGSHWPISILAQYLINAGIRSCRGAKMNIDRVDYLYNNHLKYKIGVFK